MSLNKQTTITHNKLQKRHQEKEKIWLSDLPHYSIKNFQFFMKITKQIT